MRLMPFLRSMPEISPSLLPMSRTRPRTLTLLIKSRSITDAAQVINDATQVDGATLVVYGVDGRNLTLACKLLSVGAARGAEVEEPKSDIPNATLAVDRTEDVFAELDETCCSKVDEIDEDGVVALENGKKEGDDATGEKLLRVSERRESGWSDGGVGR
ncbi:hypothetical protein NE237_024706 [Protea cynaroides]|uniref:Uncharacterized protein n=1 Tax=Protea cynaroides TaxID=273540 RepID=A0A9Q0H3V2_9MAGN|nr:hypothetical protein NE237_024706 [Protea cynaroides]